MDGSCAAAEKLFAELQEAMSDFSSASSALILRAYRVASEAHSGQMRDDGTPYIQHPLRVALSLVRELGIDDPELICAALLHDVAEDSAIGRNELARSFEARVAGIVEVLTRPSLPGGSREAINAIYFPRLRRADDDCKVVKLLDKLDNLRDVHNCPEANKRYRTRLEAEEFYLSLCDELSNRQMGEKLRCLIASEVMTLRAPDARRGI